VRKEQGLVNRELRTLEDCVKAERDLWAFCRHCGHAARVRTKTLVLRVDFIALEDAARALRCTRCKTRACVLIPERKRWVTRD
jgi:hypothetical protein